MIISKSKNFIYIHIEKTGGTSIEEALTPYLDVKDIILGGTTIGNKMENLAYEKFTWEEIQKTMLWKHADANRIKKEVGSEWNNMYKFATVRDPIEIMISFYFYIKRNIFDLLPNKITEVIYSKDFTNEISVSGSIVYTDDLRNLYFIESIIDNTGIDGFINKMIKNNLKEVSPQLSKVDESVDLFDISSINKNWKIILNKIKIYEDVSLQVINKSNRPKNIKLDPFTIKLIYNHFSIDYLKISSSITANWQ
jgi:hypothetical protein